MSMMDGLISGGVPWFPQEYAAAFYYLKGSVALLATLLLLHHMNTEWTASLSPGRRLRYLALLYLSILLAGSTAEQVQDAALVNYRNLAAFLGAVLLLVAAAVSIVESRRRP